MTVILPETRHSVKYLFIDLKNEQYGSDMSRIVEITYNDAMLEKAYEGHVTVSYLLSLCLHSLSVFVQPFYYPGIC